MKLHAGPQSKNRTTVLFDNLRGWGVRLLDVTAPKLASRFLERAFLTPPRLPEKPVETEFLQTGHRFARRTPKGRLFSLVSWGDGPTVFLLHGWGGHAGQYRAFVPALVQAGFSVIAVEAPAHGKAPGRTASISDFADALSTVVSEYGPAQGIIAHSMGGAAATLAMQRGLRVPRCIFLAPPADPEVASRAVARRMGLSETTLNRLKRRLEKKFGLPWQELSVVKAAPNMSASLLVVHDETDKQVPLRVGEAIASAWPNAELLITKNLGHSRLLTSEEVIRKVVGFLASQPKLSPDSPVSRSGLLRYVVGA